MLRNLINQIKDIRGSSGSVCVMFNDTNENLMQLATAFCKKPRTVEELKEILKRKQIKIQLLLKIDTSLYTNVSRGKCFFRVAYKLLNGMLPSDYQLEHFIETSTDQFNAADQQILISTVQAFELAEQLSFPATLFCNTTTSNLEGNVYGELTSSTVLIPASIRARYSLEQCHLILQQPEAFYVLENGHYYFGIPPRASAVWVTEFEEAIGILLEELYRISNN